MAVSKLGQTIAYCDNSGTFSKLLYNLHYYNKQIVIVKLDWNKNRVYKWFK